MATGALWTRDERKVRIADKKHKERHERHLRRLELGRVDAFFLHQPEIEPIGYPLFMLNQKSRLCPRFLCLDILVGDGDPARPKAVVGQQIEHLVGLKLLAKITAVAITLFALHHQLQFILVVK